MSLFLPEKERRVIPRWRDFRPTVETGELDGEPSGAVRPIESRGYFEEKRALWDQHQSIETAADLVASALVLGRHQEAAGAARYLVTPESEAAAAVKMVAELVLSQEEDVGRLVSAELKDIDIEADVIRLKIHALRAQLHETPRNALLWVDLSRAYSMLGQREQSIRSMERALSLGRGNRFILRSAARLFVHVDEADRAHRLLVRGDSTRRDPWLLAAEISVAAVAERKPLFWKQGRQILEGGNFPPSHTAELSSAMATLEMTAGDERSARRLFRNSLVDPTDNSLAQAEWATTKLSGIEVGPELLGRPRSFEARALNNYAAGKWRSAIGQCERWLLDEPFSSRPATLGSYLASVAEGDNPLSEALARRGLRANPGDPVLLNNLVVSLANQGRLVEALENFAKIENPPEEMRATLLATQGLLRFRAGHLKEGRERYVEAMEEARRQGRIQAAALAAVHLAREELLAGAPTAIESLRLAANACEGIEQAEILQMLSSIVRGKGR